MPEREAEVKVRGYCAALPLACGCSLDVGDRPPSQGWKPSGAPHRQCAMPCKEAGGTGWSD